MKIAVSTDLRCDLVEHLLRTLPDLGHTVEYFGPAEIDGEADWPVVTEAAARAVATHACDEAVVLCWTGTGASICANKIAGVRAALCGDAETAVGARKYNHANVLALSIRTTTAALADEILAAWFGQPWTEDAWNRTQVAHINALDDRH